jgi:hypothetical protein
MPGPADSGAVSWLVLVYRLPPKPPSLRSLVHQKLTAAGAAYQSRACAAAPVGPAECVMRRVRATITAAGGSAVLLRARALSGGPEIAAAFNAARDREYTAIITTCRDAAGTIEASDFRYEQLPDSDAALKRLDTRYRAVARHDLLGAAKAIDATAALGRYRSLLDQYARRLDARDSLS